MKMGRLLYYSVIEYLITHCDRVAVAMNDSQRTIFR